jgi:hypothetical protein
VKELFHPTALREELPSTSFIAAYMNSFRYGNLMFTLSENQCTYVNVYIIYDKYKSILYIYIYI